MASSRRRRVPVPGVIGSGLDALLDRAIITQDPLVAATVRRLLETRTPAESLRILERGYVVAAAGIGGAAGGTAALPGLGTAASVGTVALEVAAFVDATAFYVLAIAHLNGVRSQDRSYRRALVLGALMGGAGTETIEKVAGTRKQWGQVLAQRGSADHASRLDNMLTRQMVARFGVSQGALAFGRALPFGLGAGIGVAGNVALARSVISATRQAFSAPS